jgi:hypothetical protein
MKRKDRDTYINKSFDNANENLEDTHEEFTGKKNKSLIDISFSDGIKNNSNSNISNVSNITKIKNRKVYKNTKLHEYLYQEANIKKSKKSEQLKEYMQQVYPFKPTMSEKAKKIDRKETQKEFIARLNNVRKSAEEIIVKMKENNFKPNVSRGPRLSRDSDSSFYDQRLTKEKDKLNKEEIKNNLEKKKIWMENSMKSVLKMKIEKYKEIFDLLDSDKDGIISSKNIRLSNLDEATLQTLTPLLQELQSKNMDFKAFCLEADKYLAVKIFNK